MHAAAAREPRDTQRNHVREHVPSPPAARTVPVSLHARHSLSGRTETTSQRHDTRYPDSPAAARAPTRAVSHVNLLRTPAGSEKTQNVLTFPRNCFSSLHFSF